MNQQSIVKGKSNWLNMGLIKNFLEYIKMTECNPNATPCQMKPLETYANEKPFDESWEYASSVGMLMYLHSNSLSEF